MAEHYQTTLMRDRFAQAAISIPRLQQPQLSECAKHLCELNQRRLAERGREMSDDHLKQAARQWLKSC